MIFPIIPFSVSDCIVTLYTNNYLMTSSDKVQCNFSSYRFTEPYSVLLNSSLLISFQSSTGSLLTCKHPPIIKEVFTDTIFLLQPSCSLLSNNFKFINPFHIQKNRSLIPNFPFTYDKSSAILQNIHRINRIPDYINGTINNPTTWDNSLDHLNTTVNIHSNTFKFIPVFSFPQLK